ncbi:uncharacterized protein [Parasteatoda tepidariorum]|uniref:uncharacterized protein n=1 Tax=Parasteatoda tepidariorum TaxID=114398 RepID=UPI001C7187CC|nr:uncharacterized protein LOC107437888 [Parasteatoda tepidariorum]
MDNEIFELNHMRQNLVSDIEDFISSNQDKTLNSTELQTIFQLYRNLRTTFADPASNLVSLSWILYYIIEESYKSKEENSDFIVQLLQSLIENDGNTFFILNLSASAFPNKSIFEFMLDHTNKQKSLFRGYRLVCLPSCSNINFFAPVELALYFKSPKLMHCLLRYGALYSYLDGYGEKVRQQWMFRSLPCPSTRLCADIISLLINYFQEFNPEMKALLDLDDRSRSDCELLVKCGRLILRDMPLLKTRYLLDKSGKIYAKREIILILRKIETFISGIHRSFCNPLTLKHASKLEVRKALNNNWQLPCGIHELQIPTNLKNYIDLQED